MNYKQKFGAVLGDDNFYDTIRMSTKTTWLLKEMYSPNFFLVHIVHSKDDTTKDYSTCVSSF